MNKQRVYGVIFIAGMTIFGATMYELGVIRAQKDEEKHWETFQKLLDNLVRK